MQCSYRRSKVAPRTSKQLDMGAVSSTIQSNNQTVLNSISQTASANCSATCNQTQTGNTVFITGSNVGNIQFNQECTVDAKCQIDQSIEAAATAVLDSKQSASAKPGFFLGLAQANTNVQLSKQDIKNIIQTKIDSTCDNGSTQVQSANLIYVQNSTTKDIGFNQNSNVTSQCVITNIAKGTAEATAKNDQFAQAGGLGGGLIAAIILIIVIIIVVVALVAANKKKKEGEGGAPGGKPGGPPGGITPGPPPMMALQAMQK